jgi:RNA polymerase primary sigma factor
LKDTATRVLRVRSKLAQQNGREPTPDEIALHSGVPILQVQKALSLVQDPISLDLPIGEEGDATLGDLVEARDAIDPLEASETAALKRAVAKALNELTPREQQILRMRFGIDESNAHTLEEVGKVFGVTRERIRQIEAKALDKLRHPQQSRKLRVFAD